MTGKDLQCGDIICAHIVVQGSAHYDEHRAPDYANGNTIPIVVVNIEPGPSQPAFKWKGDAPSSGYWGHSSHRTSVALSDRHPVSTGRRWTHLARMRTR